MPRQVYNIIHYVLHVILFTVHTFSRKTPLLHTLITDSDTNSRYKLIKKTEEQTKCLGNTNIFTGNTESDFSFRIKLQKR